MTAHISGNDPMGIVWMFKLDGASLPQFVPRRVITFQRIGPEMALSLSQAMGFEAPTEVLQRFEKGRRCYVGWLDDKIVTYGWVTFDTEHIGELGLSIRMQANEAYIWDCATLPAYRGLRLYPALLVYILNALSSENFQRIWIGTDLDNVASQKGVALVGFQPVVEIGIARNQTTNQTWVHQREGASEQDVQDALSALGSGQIHTNNSQ